MGVGFISSTYFQADAYALVGDLSSVRVETSSIWPLELRVQIHLTVDSCILQDEIGHFLDPIDQLSFNYNGSLNNWFLCKHLHYGLGKVATQQVVTIISYNMPNLVILRKTRIQCLFIWGGLLCSIIFHLCSLTCFHIYRCTGFGWDRFNFLHSA